MAKSLGNRYGSVGVRNLSRTVSDKIDKDSFVQEYSDDFYPNLNKEEFKALLEISGEKLKGKATLKGTQLYSLRNPKSMVFGRFLKEKRLFLIFLDLEEHYRTNYQ